MSEELPPGRQLARQNRIVIAERTDWPAGAVETCEQVEAGNPDWAVFWRPENKIRGHKAPAGYYATVWDAPRESGTAYGVDAETVSAAIETLSSDCPVCGAHLPVPPGRRPPEHRDSDKWCSVPWTQTTRPADRGQARSRQDRKA